MMYHSTRDNNCKVTDAQAIAQGLAPDGGLFVPDSLPTLSLEEIQALAKLDYRGRAAAIMHKFLPSFSKEELDGFVSRAYGKNYDHDAIAPLRFTDDNTAYLELWHGPTCAFKDMALQMLPLLLTASLKKIGEQRQVCILVATSGDTGKAALEGFRDVEGTSIIVFFPRDGVSDIQKLQMTTQAGKNVLVSSVVGNFDDAQTGVKKIFSDKDFAEKLSAKGYFLSSANSINWGRLLPQVAYYVSAYCDFVNAGKLELGQPLDFCVPTGNFGNILAGWYAKQMGLPVGQFLCASNANNVLTDFLTTGTYDRNRPFHATISPSMDILVSSNLERLLCAKGGESAVSQWMAQLNQEGKYTVSEEVKASIQADFQAGFCDDEATKAEIQRVFQKFGYLIDTHTAVASKVLGDKRAQGQVRPTVVVSTASPYKFAVDVLDALGVQDPKDPLAELSAASSTTIPAPLAGLAEREVRFRGCVEKTEMQALVDQFLA